MFSENTWGLQGLLFKLGNSQDNMGANQPGVLEKVLVWLVGAPEVCHVSWFT